MLTRTMAMSLEKNSSINWESIDWRNCEFVLSDFDDGHVPENLDSSTSGKLVEYHINQRDAVVNIFEKAFRPSLLDSVYEKTSLEKTWGEYVTIERIKDYMENGLESSSETMVVEMTARYLQLCIGEGDMDPSHHHSLNDSGTKTLLTRKDLEEKCHGVAIWGLAADSGSCVPFHLDYAEQIRYSSNVIVPPLVAGTLQCTRDKLEGGDFYVSLQGIKKYSEHGYKAKKKEVSLDPSDDSIFIIPYKFNQLTCHPGNLPHGSTKIEKIHGNQLRVIVGFNVFCKEFGPIVQQAPEHSAKFKKIVQLQKLVSRNVSLSAVKNNKPLAKLLVLAKRKRVKEDFRKTKERILQEIPAFLPCTVEDIINQFCIKNTSHYTAYPDDIKNFLQRQIRDGEYEIVESNEFSPQATITLVKRS